MPNLENRSASRVSSSLRVRSVYVAASLLLLLAVFKFVDQDFLKQTSIGRDFRPAYLSTRLWMEGRQPYDAGNMLLEVKRAMPENYAYALSDPDLRYSLYPPSCFPILAFLGSMSWHVAAAIEMLCCAGSYAFLLLICALRLSGVRRFYFATFGLAFAPFHGGFETGNLSALSGPLACAAVLLASHSPLVGGIALGVAAALKPQLAGLFILHLLLSRRWKAFAAAAGTFLASVFVGVGWLLVHKVSWIAAYQANVHIMLSPYADNKNAITDATRINFQLFNLQPLIFWITKSLHFAVNMSVWLFAGLFGLYLTVMWRLRKHRLSEEQRLACLSVLSLLPFIAVYQQFYSAVPLLLVFLWALQHWESLSAKILTFYGLIFAIPITKLAVLALMIEVGTSHHNQTLAGVRHGMLQGGIPAGLGRTPLEELALALPSLFIAIALLLVLPDLLLRSVRVAHQDPA